MRDQNTTLLLILLKTACQQVSLKLRVHVLSEEGEHFAARTAAITAFFFGHGALPSSY